MVITLMQDVQSTVGAQKGLPPGSGGQGRLPRRNDARTKFFLEEEQKLARRTAGESGVLRDGPAHAKARRWAKDAAQVSESGTPGVWGGGRGVRNEALKTGGTSS